MLIFLLSSLVFAQENTTNSEKDPNAQDDQTSSSKTNDTDASDSEKSNSNTESSTDDAGKNTTNSEVVHAPQNEKPTNAPQEILFDPNTVETLDTHLTDEQIQWLKPSRGKLPQNPYQHIDFTAYTLEFGEVQLGINRTTVGILPRTQIGTQLPLWALGISNVNAKANILRLGPFDLAITGNYLNLPSANMTIQYYGFGGYGSLRLMENWSIHAGGQYATLHINGVPDISKIGGPLKTFTGVTDADIQTITDSVDQYVNYSRDESILNAKIATDIRLNRRDSFIIQGNYLLSQNTGKGIEVTAENTGISLSPEDISSPLFRYLLVPTETSSNYSASIAYQASFKRAYLRLGVGYSNVPYSWLLQSVDLTWRLGGKTKRRDNHLEKVWELNKKAIKNGADQR